MFLNGACPFRVCAVFLRPSLEAPFLQLIFLVPSLRIYDTLRGNTQNGACVEIMSDSESRELWRGIIKALEEKLQFGFLEQERSVVDVRFDGGELTLVVSDKDAADFFNAEVNQQRLMIVSRSIVSIEKIVVEMVEASPLES